MEILAAFPPDPRIAKRLVGPDARVAERLVPVVLKRAAGLRVLGLCLARQAGVLPLALRVWRAGGGPRVLRISPPSSGSR